jgi:hypothetical protein
MTFVRFRQRAKPAGVPLDGSGSGMRFRDAALDVGDELTDAGERYRVVHVEQPKSVRSFGHAWTELIGSRGPRVFVGYRAA